MEYAFYLYQREIYVFFGALLALIGILGGVWFFTRHLHRPKQSSDEKAIMYRDRKEMR